MVDGARRSERASAGMVTVLSLLAVGLVTVIVSLTAQAAVGAARAQAAADAAALGAVLEGLEGEDEAGALARANGARLIAYETRGSCVEVLVVLGRSQARARAAVLDATGGYAC